MQRADNVIDLVIGIEERTIGMDAYGLAISSSLGRWQVDIVVALSRRVEELRVIRELV